MVQIAVIGTGSVGAAIALALSKKGYQVTFGSRDPKSEKSQKVAQESQVKIDSVENAIKHSEVIFLATPWDGTLQAVKSFGDLQGKVLVDMTNPIGPNLTLAVGKDTSGGEEVAKVALNAKVVKAFNTMGCNLYLEPDFGGQKADLYIAGDDKGSKDLLAKIGTSLGFDIVDCGGIQMSRYTEPLALLWINLAYPQKWGRNHAFKLLKK